MKTEIICYEICDRLYANPKIDISTAERKSYIETNLTGDEQARLLLYLENCEKYAERKKTIKNRGRLWRIRKQIFKGEYPSFVAVDLAIRTEKLAQYPQITVEFEYDGRCKKAIDFF